MLKNYNYDVKTVTHLVSACLLSCNRVAESHANCTRVAASCMQISVDFIHVACDWRPRGYNYMRLAASPMRILRALAASCVQSRQFFASTLREQLFEIKNEDAFKKSENIGDTCAC
jgi:hypothetical protein